MKTYKAPGVDGWRAQELKQLPWPAIVHLSEMFAAIRSLHLSEDQMLARNILLPKIPVRSQPPSHVGSCFASNTKG